MTLRARYYQTESVDAIFAEWGNYRGALLHLTMSLGKTVVMGMTAERIIAGGGRVLLFCHLGELLDDGAGGGAFHVFKRIMPTARIFFEQNVEKVSRYDIKNESPDIVMGTVQSLRRRLEKYPPDFFSHIFIDEGHRGAAQTYLEVIHAFPEAKVLYVTATPQKLSKLTKAKGDETKRSLKGYIFEDIDGEKKKVSLCGDAPAYQMDFGRAVKEGWVVEPIPVEAKVDIDWSTLRMSGGDYSESHLDEIMKEDAPLHEVANAIVANGKTVKRIVFMPGCDSARGLAHLLRTSYGVLADCVDGKTDKVLRKEIIGAFKGEGVDCLVNVLVGTEGFDCPGIEEVVIGRPTRSEGLYCLDEKTEILTDRGWLSIDDKIGDALAAAFDVESGKIDWSPILGEVRRTIKKGESMYGIASPTADIRVSDKHRMVWRPKRGGRWCVSEASELSAKRAEYEIPIAGLQDADGVPLTDDEIRFIGWVMTDGSINKTNKQIVISQSEHQPWNENIVSCLKGCGLKYSVHRVQRVTQFKRTSDGIVYTISKGKPRGRDKDLRGWSLLEPYISKDLHQSLEAMTRAQLAVLLEAMHLGDGDKQQGQSWVRRSYHISTARKAMADRLQSLCVRRGFKCNISEHFFNKNPIYILHIKDRSVKYIGGRCYSDRKTFMPVPHKAGERIWCIETKKGTIITRRHGKVAIVGNCQIMGRGQRLNPGDLVDQFPAKEDAPARLAAIAASPKPRFRLVDLVGNLGNLPKPISGKDVLIGELPHKEYGNQPRPEDKDVREVAARNPDLTVDELRQRASDELYMQEVLMGVRWRHSVHADVRLHEYKDFFSIPFTIPEPKKAKVHKKPPPGKEATPKQLGLLRSLYDSWYDKRPNPEWIASLTKKQAGRIIDDLQKKLEKVREVVDA